MNVILLGQPGSGKGTQASKICEFYCLLHVSPGELARREVIEKSKIGTSIDLFLGRGHLLPTEIVLSLILSYLQGAGTSHDGYLFDGVPRTLGQTRFIEQVLKEDGRSLDAVINLWVDPSILLKRLCGRFSCRGCKTTYNRYFLTPTTGGICDHCGGTGFTHRGDDNEEIALNRLAVYNSQTKPVLNYFENQGLLRTIDGMQSPNKVLEQVRRYLSRCDRG